MAEMSPSEKLAAAKARGKHPIANNFFETFDFELDDFQIKGCYAIESGKGVLVAAPTGAGKTNVALLTIMHEIGKHLRPDGLRTASGTEKLTCASCHVAEASGAAMKPVRMEENCGRCHNLAFEPSHPEWRLPHGDPAVIRSTIAGFYSLMALSSRPDADLADKDVRRPGVTARSEALQRQADKEWVEARTREAIGTVWGPSGCGQCHAATLIDGEYTLRATSNHRSNFENWLRCY